MSTPKEFDVDAWLDDAERPARSVTVYQKASLLADLDELAERINNEDAEEVDGPSMGGGNLRSQYAELAQMFHDSALTIRIEGRSEREREDVALRVPNLTPAQAGAVVLADAITSPKFTPEQVEKLSAKLGDVQFSRIVTRFHEACNDMPAVSADFLPKRSTPDDGGE